MPVPPAIVGQFQIALRDEKFAAARSLAERALILAPADAVAHDMARAALVGQSAYALALPHARCIVELVPAHAPGWSSLGALLATLDDHPGAVAAFRRAAALEPDRPHHRVELATALLNAKELIEAERTCAEGLAEFPGETGLVFRRAAALAEMGSPDAAAAVLGEALFADPANLHLAMTMCANSNYAATIDRNALAARHRNFGRLVMLADPRTPLKHVPPKPGPAPVGLIAPGRGKDGRVRVGILSSDLRQHSVAYFIEPVLAHLDRARFELFAYANDPREDAMTRRLQRALALGPSAERAEAMPEKKEDTALECRATVKNWRRISMLDGYRVAKVVADDRIDILIELNGLTAGARWDTLRLKPAPLQVTYCGYPNSTGLPTVDLRIVDSITDPPGDAGTPSLAEQSAVERLARLDPCFLCYAPPPAAEAPAHRGEAGAPVDRAHITFGSFNTLTKLSPPTLRAWGAILARVPGARLVIKGTSFSDAAVRAQQLARFAAAGLDAARVELLPGTPGVRAHLETYQRIDIALDTFPYAGTTTTCEALFMGVPVISLARPWEAGGVHAERVGASLLTAVGRAELVTTSVENYIECAAALAQDVVRLAGLHRSLREELLASPLCDRAAFGARFSHLLTQAWNRWATPRP